MLPQKKPQVVSKVKISAILGMSLDEAKEYLARMGMVLRATSVDGKPRVGTCDVRPNRVNVALVDGYVDQIGNVG